MKPKDPKQPPSLPHMQQEPSPEAQQVLTFETVEELLSYDRRETEVPEHVSRRLRVSVPGHEFKPVPPAPEPPEKPRPEEP